MDVGFDKNSTPNQAQHNSKQVFHCLFSFKVLQLEMSMRLILPQRFLILLYVTSSMAFVLNSNCNQPSVSLHSLRAISNLDNMSALL